MIVSGTGANPLTATLPGDGRNPNAPGRRYHLTRINFAYLNFLTILDKFNNRGHANFSRADVVQK